MQASLALGRTGRWEIRYSERQADGAWRSRTVSTRTADRQDAERFLAGWTATVQAAASATPHTVSDLTKIYLQDARGRGLVRSSENALLGPVARYFGGLTPSQITPAVIAQHRSARQNDRTGAPVTANTLRRELIALGTVLRYAVKIGLLKADEVPYISLPPVPAGRDVWLTEEQEGRFLALASASSAGAPRLTRIHRFVWLGLCTGARSTALLELRWPQVDLQAGLIDFRQRRRTKKRRVPVPLADRLRPVLERAHQERRGDFVIDHPGRIRRDWDRLVQGTEFDQLTPHDMRRTFATLLARAGVDLWQVAGLLGDTLEVVTAHYAHHHPSYLRDAINRR